MRFILSLVLVSAFVSAPALVRADEVLPTIELAAKSDTGVVGDNITSKSSNTFFVGTADAYLSDFRLVTTPEGTSDEIHLGLVKWLTNTTWEFGDLTPGGWSFTDGVHNFKLQTIFPGGSSGPTTDTLLSVTFDSTPPVITEDAGDFTALDALDGEVDVIQDVLPEAAGTYQVVYSATDRAGNTSTTTKEVIVAATLTETGAVPAVTNSSSPEYSFRSTLAGSIEYEGECTSLTTEAIVGENTVVFEPLEDGEYVDCILRVPDGLGTKISLEVSSFIVDTEAPVITLLGDATISLTEGEALVLPDIEATATDTHDGDVAVTSEGVEDVDTAVAGTYLITYSAEDAAGNEATPVTRTIEVVAVPAPSSGGGGGGGGSSGGSRRSSSSSSSGGSIDSGSVGEVLGASTYRFAVELSPGMSGSDVVALQELLKTEGFFAGEATGFYGTQTYNAVAAYQKSHGLPAAGRVGPQTLALLNQGSVGMSETERLALLTQLLALLAQLQALLAAQEA
ncbi:DUF5011 domain-containing protein [Patescibacteria group bacterium]|nr:DUF5011 domain-containing protein [Patescibacteria group bacterium]MBU1500480.1 DUF5011 domain-containing protein [Patescibacteria group bacterium]